MTTKREKFSSQAAPELLAALREIARADGRPFRSVLEEAMGQFVASRNGDSSDEEVMAHFRASMEKHRRLGELLAQ